MDFDEVKKKIFLSKEEKKFINLNKKKIKISKQRKYIVLEVNNNHFSLVHYAFLINEKRFEKYKFIGLWTPITFRERGFINFLKFILKYIIFELEKKKWEKLYSSIGLDKLVSLNDNFKSNFFIYKNSFTKNNLKITKKKKISQFKVQKKHSW